VWLSVRIQQDEQMVRHTLAVQHQVTQILSLVQHVETNQRGYLLTGRSIYLDNYKGAERTLSEVMDEASRLVAGSPQQRQTVARLRQVVNLALDAAPLGCWQYDPLYCVFLWDTRTKEILGIAEDRGAPKRS
jgi:CHASE3 domain sensor protein